jgi:uncharacterized SAM-binding protein YcdF (DUF218 family)
MQSTMERSIRNWRQRALYGAALITGLLTLGFIGFLVAIAPVSTSATLQRAHGLVAQPLQDVPSEPADAIVVLTGGRARIEAAIALFKQGHARRLLISGVNRQTTRDDLKRLMAVDPVLFDCCVDIGYAALDTIGNAVEAKAWSTTWAFDRIILVTANYHMPRTRIEFQRALPHVDIVFHSVTPKRFGAGWWRDPAALTVAGHEYLKLLGAIVRHGASDLVEAAIERARPADAYLIRKAPETKGSGPDGVQAENPVRLVIPRL